MSSLKVRTNQQVTASPPPRESQGSTLQNSTLHNWFRHVPSCWFGHVPTQLTMDSTEDTAIFNAVDGVHAVNEYKTMQWTMQPSASGVE